MLNHSFFFFVLFHFIWAENTNEMNRHRGSGSVNSRKKSQRSQRQMLCFLQLCKYKTVLSRRWLIGRRVKQSKCNKNKAIKIRWVYIYTPLDLLKLSKPEQYYIIQHSYGYWMSCWLSHEGMLEDASYCNYTSARTAIT